MRLILATCAAALTIFAAAAPQPSGQRGGFAISIYNRKSAFSTADNSVDLHAVDAHIASVDAKIYHGFENYEKNTGVKHPYAVESLEKRNNIPLINENVYYWYGTIFVGTPARPFTVVFDTGSGDFFLPGSTCYSCSGHSLWDPASSSTSISSNWFFLFKYTDGSIAVGDMHLDNVSIAGFDVKRQFIGVATTYSPPLQRSQFPADGVMGFGFQTISTYAYIRPVFTNLVIQQPDIEPVFSFKLSSAGAELYIGGSNSMLYAGSFTYVPVTIPALWQVMIDNIQVDGQTILDSIPAVIDTGSALITGTISEVILLHTFLRGMVVLQRGHISHFTFPCDSFPTISLTFGGTSFSIPPSALNLGPGSPGSHMCVSGIYPNTVDAPFWTIGHVFLQNVYTTFHLGDFEVGFAQLAR